MNKYDGLNVKQINGTQSENVDFSKKQLTNSVAFSHEEENESLKAGELTLSRCVYPIKRRQKNKMRGFFKGLLFQIATAGIMLLFLYSLTLFKSSKIDDVITSIKNSINYSDEYSLSEDIFSNSFKKQVTDLFAPVFTKSLSEQLDIMPPIFAVEILQEDKAIVYKTNEMAFVKSGLDGRIKKINNKKDNRYVEILCDNSIVLRYSNLSIIGTQEGKKINRGDVFASCTQNVKIEMFYKDKQIELKLSGDGKIEWVK